MDSQSAFARALFDPALPPPPGLRTWNGSDPALRFAVYCNNVMVSLVDALADAFPVVQQLVGTAFFRAMAALFVRQQAPRSRVLAQYGEGFADFVLGFEPAAVLPYLADVARLEWARTQAYHAADALALRPETIAQALTDPQTLSHLRLRLHPSTPVLRSRFAAFDVWAAHQQDEHGTGLEGLDWHQPQAVVVYREGLEVMVLPVPQACADFCQRLLLGIPLGAAAAAVEQAHPDFDLAATLALLLQRQWITALETGTSL